ncbi:MAG: alpha/beta fold hydrolase [Planctomycetota bacterium]
MLDAGPGVVNELYPFASHFFEVPGGRLHYLDEGSGPPIVMLHGNPTWSFYYRDLVKDLRGRFRVIVPDHVGCGLSDKPGDDRYPYTLRRRVEDLEALLEHLGVIRDITMVVHDWGGMIGFAFATRHPERIRRLVVLNTAAFHLPKGKRFPWQLALVRNTPFGSLLVRGLNAFCLGTVRFGCTRSRLPEEVKRGYLAPYDSWDHRIAVLRFVQDIPLRPGDPGHDLVSEVESNLGRLKDVPMLICWGERDFVFDGEFLGEWERRFPAAKVHRFADAGHLVLEDAASEVRPLICQFVG